MTRKLPAGLRAAAVVILGALLGGADGGRDQPSAAYGLQSTSEPVCARNRITRDALDKR